LTQSATVIELANVYGGVNAVPRLASVSNVTAVVPAVKRVHWLEVRAQSEPAITPASRRVVETWRSAGLDVRASAVAGEPFWSTLDIAECAALLDATDEAMRSSQ
jgi:hypothetical protein